MAAAGHLAARLASFNKLQDPQVIERIVKSGETHYEGGIYGVMTAAPTIAQKVTDESGVAHLCVCLQEVVGDGVKTARYLAPDSGFEVGPYTYTAGGATAALVGTDVFVDDSQSVDILANVTNANLLGRITRVVSATLLMVKMTLAPSLATSDARDAT